MARSTFSTSNYINCGSGSTLDNLTIGSVLAWVTYPSTTTGTVFAKGTSTARVRLQHSTSLVLEVGGTPALEVSATDANCTGAGTSKAVFCAATWDRSLTNADQKLFTGDRVTVCTEPAAYGLQTVGGGAHGDDSGADLALGIFSPASAPSGPWQGALAIVQILNRQITLAEARSWQFYPRYLPGTVGLWVPGWDDDVTVPDLSGTGNDGTLVGSTTRTADVPLNLAESLFGEADEEESEPWGWAGAAPAGGPKWRDRRRVAALIAAGFIHVGR